MKQRAQIKIGFAGLLIFFILVTLVSAQELQENENTAEQKAPETADTQPIEEIIPEQETIEPPKEELPQEPTVNSPQITVVSPLFGEEVSGNVLVIAAILPSEKITTAFFEIENTKKELTLQNNFTEVFDSTQFSNGEYKLTVQACIQESCTTQTLPIKIANQKLEPEQNPIEDKPVIELPDGTLIPKPGATIKVKGSELLSALTVFNKDGTIEGSGTDYFEIEHNTYNVQLDFFDSFLNSIYLNQINLDKSGVIFEINEKVDVFNVLPYNENFDWVQIIPFKSNYFFSEGKILLNEKLNSEFLVQCNDWNEKNLQCNSKFEIVNSPENQKEITLQLKSQSTAIGIVKKKPITFLVTPSNVKGKFSFYNKAGLAESIDGNSLLLFLDDYDAKFDFFENPISTIKFTKLNINHAGTVAKIEDIKLAEKETKAQIQTPNNINEIENIKSNDFITQSIEIDYNFELGKFFVSKDVNEENVQKCENWNKRENTCDKWTPSDLSLSSGIQLLKFSKIDQNRVKPIDENFVSEYDQELVEVIKKLKKVRESNRHFKANFSREQFTALKTLFGDIEINLECTAPQAPITEIDLNDSKPLEPIDANELTPVQEFPVQQTEAIITDANFAEKKIQQEKPIIFFQDLIEENIESDNEENENIPDQPDSNNISEFYPESFFTNEWEDLKPQKLEWLQNEDALECDGINLENLFKDDSTPEDTEHTITLGGSPTRVKQEIKLKNDTNTVQTRIITTRFATPIKKLESDTNSFNPKKTYQLVRSKISKVSFQPQTELQTDLNISNDENTFIENNEEFEIAEFMQDSVLRFYDSDNSYLGYYDWADLSSSLEYVKTVIHEKDNQSIIETVLEVSIQPNQTILLDPSFDLNFVHFGLRFYGGTADDQLGFTSDNNLGVQLVDVDNNGYTNDLLITSVNADVNSKGNVGAVYLIKDIDKKFGEKGLNAAVNYDALWNGGSIADFLGRAQSSSNTPGYTGALLYNVDGNATKNDLVLIATFADVNGKSNVGAVYLIKDINAKYGANDLATLEPTIGNSATGLSLRFNGGKDSDNLGTISRGGTGLYVLDIDNNGRTNDLIIGCSNCDINGKSNSGAVYLIKDIDRKYGSRDLNNVSSATLVAARWNANSNGGEGFPNSNTSGNDILVVNVDNNATANDLVLTSFYEDVNGKTANGAVYLIKDINAKYGSFDLTTLAAGAQNSATGLSARWNGGTTNDYLGSTGIAQGGLTSGPGVYVINSDNNANANDLLLVSSTADVNGKFNNGAIYLIKDIGAEYGSRDLNTAAATARLASTTIDLRLNGGGTSEHLGYTGGSSFGVQLVNVDNNAYANDLLITATLADVNGKANSGAVYLIKNIDKKYGSRDLNDVTTQSLVDVRWNGGTTTDELGYTKLSGLGVQLANLDNNAGTNDLIITSVLADVNGKANSGAIYLIKDINTEYGSKDLNNVNTITGVDARWNGESANAQLGNSNQSGQGVQIANIDGNLQANDLIVTDVNADVNGKTENGAIYLIRDVNKKYGSNDLATLPPNSINTATGLDAMWAGPLDFNRAGDTNRSSLGVQIVNVDNNSYSNDLLITGTGIFVNNKYAAGAVYLIKDIDREYGLKDLNVINVAVSGVDIRFSGGSTQNQLGNTRGSNLGVQSVNLDGNGYNNDLILTSVLADSNSKANSGSIFILTDIHTKVDNFSFSLNYPSTGCTEGKGSLDAGVTCDRLYFDSTDLTGIANETNVNPEGQTSTIPFLVYDNQSSTPIDFNVTLNFNASIPANYKMKVSKIYAGWSPQCSGNTDNNCAQIDISGLGVRELTPTEDVYILEQEVLQLNARTFMKFDISSITLNGLTITDVNLELHGISAYLGDDNDASFYHMDQNQNWTESSSGNDLNKMHRGTNLAASNCYPSVQVGGSGDSNCSILTIFQAAYNQRDYNFSFEMDDPDVNDRSFSSFTAVDSSTILGTGGIGQIGAVPRKTFSSSEAGLFVRPRLYVHYNATPLNVGRAVYTAGTQDLNLFAWGDFVNAPIGSIDRNTISTSIPPD